MIGRLNNEGLLIRYGIVGFLLNFIKLLLTYC